MTTRSLDVVRRRERGTWHYIGLGLSWGAVLLVAALAVILIVLPLITGATPLTVLTSSMRPTLPPGTLVVVSPTAPADLRIGDVITFQIRSGDPTLVTHRIIGIDTSSSGERSFRTQGDNNPSPDPDAILAEQVNGRLWYSVPLIGWANTALNSDARSWIVPVAAAALFGYAAFMIGSGVRARIRSRRDS